MDVSLNWLKALAPGIDGTPAEIADRLSMSSVTVESITEVGAELDGIVVGRVVEAGPHPNADRLTLCKVDDGSGGVIDVVCGAQNVEPGASYAYVRPGAELPGGFRIESREIRGELSHGMLCSEKELGLGRDAGGILKLDDGYRPGQRLTEALGLPDARLELDLTPNRIDMACHAGVARELAPRGDMDVELPRIGDTPWEPVWVDGESAVEVDGVRIEIDAPDRCFRYLAAVVRGVRIGSSPDWLAARLRGAGSRPINNVVDSTNYVLLESNQPLHAFDLHRIEGSEIRIRAAAGEALRTLDGVDHELGPEVSVIADAVRPIALAGVMGGGDSEVSEGTIDVLLECASFDPQHTRKTARDTGLSTDASYRFERGIDERGMERALQRCVDLVVATAGGRPDPQGFRVGRAPAAPRTVTLRRERVRQVLGLRLSAEQISELLRPLGMTVTLDGADTLLVEVPTWRVDISQEVDLLEEVARRYGYDRFPDEPRSFRPSTVPDSPVWLKVDAARESAVGLGFFETRSVSFVPRGLTSGDPVALLHPLSADEGFLRTDLVPVLVRALENNYANGRRDVRLFEIGTVFGRSGAGLAEDAIGTVRGIDVNRDGVPDVDAPFAEELRGAVLFTGRRAPDHWSGDIGDMDIWDLKGFLEGISERLGLGRVHVGAPPGEPSGLSFGTDVWMGDKELCLFDGPNFVGVGGRVSPTFVDSPPWAASVFALEFRLAAVHLDRNPEFRPLPEYPAVTRDIALDSSVDVSAEDIRALLWEAAPEILESAEVFDVYQGEGVGEGRRSLAWRLVFRSSDRTLRDREVDRSLKKLISSLEARFDVRVRSS